MAAESALHQEFQCLGRTVWTAGTLAVVGLAVAASEGLPMTSWRSWLGFGSLLVVMASAVAFETYQMNRIVLTPTRLRVGRELFQRADFDFRFGVQPPLILSVEEQDRTEEEWPLPPDADMRIAGGSWGRRRGTSMLVMKEAETGRLLAIFSRRPAELDRALTAWLETPEL